MEMSQLFRPHSESNKFSINRSVIQVIAADRGSSERGMISQIIIDVATEAEKLIKLGSPGVFDISIGTVELAFLVTDDGECEVVLKHPHSIFLFWGDPHDAIKESTDSKTKIQMIDMLERVGLADDK